MEQSAVTSVPQRSRKPDQVTIVGSGFYQKPATKKLSSHIAFGQLHRKKRTPIGQAYPKHPKNIGRHKRPRSREWGNQPITEDKHEN